MNSMDRQLVIREFELFVSGGVNELPKSVFEQDTRAAGEFRVVRQEYSDLILDDPNVRTISIGVARIDRKTGKIIKKTSRH